MGEVIYTDEFGEWFEGLSHEDQLAVYSVVDKLELLGVSLGYPHSSALEGSKFPLRELRAHRGASPLRVVYAYDPRREAVLLIGGSKADAGFYPRLIRRAEEIWTEYLAEQREGGQHD